MPGAATRTPALVPADPFDVLPAGAVVAVAMSGGVDSSVAAARCLERGIPAVGVTLAMWPRDRDRDRDRGCCSVDAVEDARRVCATLGIPHYAWDLEARFAAEVIEDYADEYAAGRTPNPCVRCNERIKFGALLERALAVGATHVATGHYARIGIRDGAATLHRAADPRKDQAYTLSRIGRAGLRRAVFPVGGHGSKADVRAEARRLGLGTAGKPDSQELCFVEGRVRDDLARRLRGRFAPGEIVDASGRVVGEHDGLPFHTVGQRRGLRLSPDRPDAAPLHVLRLEVATNRVVVGPRAALAASSLVAVRCAWLGAPPEVGEAVGVQVRAHGGTVPAVVAGLGGADAAEPETVALELREPLDAAAPGQAVVILDGVPGDEILGGGVLEKAAAAA
ncbi:MAG TPA: tRNA 2-thiouridine(34) synthase MnmA [Candidatus Dormibacteraeota bacterium]|nr:tRNA 2-thiouridine(34) synthase MnmA [Candidatus Dormibacteraeota bacterium]